MEIVLQILLVVFLLLFLGHFLSFRGNLDIRVHGGSVEVRGVVAIGKRQSIVGFFHADLPDVRDARVSGNWDGRRLQLRFRGKLTPGQKQRIRNFLLTTL